MTAIPSFPCKTQQLLAVAPLPVAALPHPCAHARLSIGLDQAYCPDCRRDFKPRTSEYKSAIALELPIVTARSCPGERDKPTGNGFYNHSQPDPSVPQDTPDAAKVRDSKHTPANGWIEKYLSKGRWEYHRYCWRLGRKGKTNKRHIPSDSGKLLAVRSAIASGKSPQEIEQLIKSWKATDTR